MGQNALEKVGRAVLGLGGFLSQRLEVRDPDGGKVLLVLDRPGGMGKSRITIEDGEGTKIGEIVQ